MSEAILSQLGKGMLLVSDGYRPGMLRTSHRAQDSPHNEGSPALKVSSIEAETLWENQPENIIKIKDPAQQV